MSKDIAKSPEMLEKEAKVTTLKKQLKKRKTILKSLKTRLSNTQTNIEDVQRDVQSKVMSKMMEMDNLRVEISTLAREFQKAEGISDEDKKALGEMADELAEGDFFGEGFTEYKEQREKMERGEFEFEEEFRAKMNDAYEQFRVKPPEKEQRNIRSVFLKLSKKFHPDLAQTPQEEEEFHSLMQQINEAYKSNDVQTLLELEQMYLVDEIDFSNKAITIDVLDEEIKRLQRDLDFIEGQIERTSSEIKNLRTSDMGQMLTSMNKAEREGEGINAMVNEMEESINMLTKLRDGLKDSIERDEISPILIELMNPFANTPLAHLNISPDSSPEEVMQQMFDSMSKGEFDPQEAFEQMFGKGANPMDMMNSNDGPFNIFDIFGDDDDDEFENPTFPIGSSVRVAKSIPHPNRKKLDMKGWTGRVTDVYEDFHGNEMYDIEWDSHTLRKIPSKLIENMTKREEDFQEGEFEVSSLEACEPLDTENETFTTYRTLLHQNKWKFLKDKAQAERLQKILLKHPNASDGENWYHHLMYELSFPFNARKSGLITGETHAVKVTGIAFLDEEYGVIVSILKGKKADTYPLMDLEVSQKTSKNYQIVEDYLEWAEEL